MVLDLSSFPEYKIDDLNPRKAEKAFSGSFAELRSAAEFAPHNGPIHDNRTDTRPAGSGSQFLRISATMLGCTMMADGVFSAIGAKKMGENGESKRDWAKTTTRAGIAAVGAAAVYLSVVDGSYGKLKTGLGFGR